MNPELIQALEEDCAEALAKVMDHYQVIGVTPQVLHLMSKAAVTVLEAVEATVSQNPSRR